MRLVGFQGNNTCGEWEKDYDEFEAVNVDETRIGTRQFEAALDSLGSAVDVKTKPKSSERAPPATWLASPAGTEVCGRYMGSSFSMLRTPI
jgi:hypothetical protein